MNPVERFPEIDDLDREIVSISSHLNASTYELLTLIREFDERVGWLKWGFLNCADWLHWRCDLSLNAAREKVRVAHALKALPEVSAAFRDGELSYSKVRALVRVANRDSESDLLDFALRTTATRVEERCRELRCGSPNSVFDANRAYSLRYLAIRRDLDRGIMTMTVELPLEVGELVDKALDKARDDHPGVEFVAESWSARQADALVTMVKTYLAGGQEASAGTSEHYLVNVHVQQSALANGEGRAGLPIESVKRIACDSDTVLIVENDNGEPLSVGRKTRTVPIAIKRALNARDGGCTFPGCHHTRFVDAHHVQHWSAGGETSLDNLISLCSQHHRLVHEGGYRIDKDYRDQWIFRRPDGIAVPACGYRVDDMQDDVAGIAINALRTTPRSDHRVTGGTASGEAGSSFARAATSGP